MGYTTEFKSSITLNRKIDIKTAAFLHKLNKTRRMKRKDLDPKYGIDGEFYVDGKGDFGQDNTDPTIVDYNHPPSTQPSLWCQWIPTENKKGIEWDGGEKFYESEAWMRYIIDKILAPKGYVANGTIEAQGEDDNDRWTLFVENNKVYSKTKDQQILENTKDEDLPTLINHEWYSEEAKELYIKRLSGVK